jgi:DNA polymerase elongation subunit (family B)
LWESKNGKTVYSCLDHKAAYYVKDPTDTSDITDIYGTRVIKKFAESKKALSQIRKAVKTYESDISEEVKFLHARYGDSEERVPSSDYNTVALDIEIEVVGEFPKPELAKYPINLITINFINRGKVWTIGNRPYTGDSELVKNYECVEDEKQLLTRFIEVWRRSKIDIVTGWNVDTFDLQYIINRCKNLNVDCSDLSPVGKVEVKKNGKCFIAGITILDYIDLYKKFSFTPQPSYKLEYICQYELKKGKKHYEGSIFDIYKNDWNLFVEYNIVDTILIGDLEAKRKFIDLAINLCTESRTPLEKVVSSIWVIEGYILRYLHRYNKIMPDRQSSEESEYDEDDEDDGLLGGYVEAHPGFYKFLLSFDVESLYPHMIMMFNISPETKIKNPESSEGLIKSPVEGVYYSKQTGILPEIVETIFKERKAFKTKMFEAEKDGNEELTEYYDSMQMVRKILINSIFGVLGNRFFHFFDNDNASVITAGGRELIQFLSQSTNSYFKDFLPKIITKTYPECSTVKAPARSVHVADTDSVIGSTIIHTSNGDMTIEQLYDLVRSSSIEKSKDNFVAPIKDIESLTVDRTSVVYKPITYIKKHLVEKRMFKLTVAGKSVVITEDHSVIVMRDNVQMSISPKEIKKGDRVIYVNKRRTI